MSKRLRRVRLHMTLWCLFWCVVSLAGWCLPLHICEWAKWFVWDQSRGGGRDRRSGGATQPRHAEPRKRAICVMSWLPGHSTLCSQLPSFPPSQTPPPTVSLAFALLLWVHFWLPVTDTGLDTVIAAQLFMCPRLNISICTFTRLLHHMSFPIAARSLSPSSFCLSSTCY